MRLAELQHAFQARVLLGDRVIEAIVPGNERFDTATRLGIYEHAFIARLTEALAVTYPALKSALGESAFADLIQAYVAASPPSHFSIRYYGHNLFEFVLAHLSGTKAKVLSELAQWEWLLSEAFDAADAVAIKREALSRIAPDQWGQVGFCLSPSFGRLRLTTNAVQWWRAASRSTPRPTRWRSVSTVQWAIWRSDLATYFRSLKPDEAWAIDALSAGQSFASLCEGLVRFCGDGAPLRAATLVHRWVSDGWIVDIEVSGILTSSKRLRCMLPEHN